MNITRNILAATCILVGAITIVAYFWVLYPKGNTPAIDIVLVFTFAILFMAGGLLAIFKQTVSIYLLIAACLFYVVAGLYNPISLYGYESLYKIDTQFYIGVLWRSVLVGCLVAVILKQRVDHVRAGT